MEPYRNHIPQPRVEAPARSTTDGVCKKRIPSHAKFALAIGADALHVSSCSHGRPWSWDLRGAQELERDGDRRGKTSRKRASREQTWRMDLDVHVPARRHPAPTVPRGGRACLQGRSHVCSGSLRKKTCSTRSLRLAPQHQVLAQPSQRKSKWPPSESKSQ